jgi:hypothetical protein
MNPVTDASCNPISNGFLATWYDPMAPPPLGQTRSFTILVLDTNTSTTTTINWGNSPLNNKQYSSVIQSLDPGHTYTVTINSIEGASTSSTVFSSLTPGASGVNTFVTDYLNTGYLSNVSSVTANTKTQIFYNPAGSDLEQFLYAKTAIGSPSLNITMGARDGVVDPSSVYTAYFNYLFANPSKTYIPQSVLQINANLTNGSLSTTEIEATFQLNISTVTVPTITNISVMQVTDKSGGYTVITPDSVTQDSTYLTVVFKTVPQSSYVIFGELNNGHIPCFPAGTRILTHQGYKNVEDINDKQDKVITSDGRTVPCVIVSTHITKTNKNSAPYMIEANAFGPMSPPKDILLSPQHAIQSSKDVWQIPEYVAKHNPKVYQVDLGKPITYYHIECPNYFTDNLVAEDAVVESLGWYQVSDQNVYEFDPEIQGLRRTEQKQQRYAVFDQIEQEKGLNIKLAF